MAKQEYEGKVTRVVPGEDTLAGYGYVTVRVEGDTVPDINSRVRVIVEPDYERLGRDLVSVTRLLGGREGLDEVIKVASARGYYGLSALLQEVRSHD